VEACAGLLRGAGWTGVAMVEFKLDARSGIPRLMEVNARFWGSLQLAISAGVDFPFLLYRHALGERPSPPPAYRVGVASRWELGDLDHLLIRLRRRPGLQLPLHAPPLPRAVLHFLADFFRPAVRHEVFRPNDPAPFVAELQQYVQKLVCPPERRS
jgi:predicted ATP-grasp superfamily ATP-dependent carboligase